MSLIINDKATIIYLLMINIIIVTTNTVSFCDIMVAFLLNNVAAGISFP